MKCSRCHFENIPGQGRCFKCGSVLEAVGSLVNVHPPRMSAWRRPGRGLARWFRHHTTVAEKLPGERVRRGLNRLVSDGMVGAAFSIAPGLPHLVTKRFREVRLLVLLWAAFLATGLFLYGHIAGVVLIGLAIGVHAWIAIQFGLLTEITGFIERMITVLLVMGCFAAVYWATPRVVFRGYTSGYTAMDIPDRQIRNGDYFLVRRIDAREETLSRGALVLVRPQRFENNRLDMFSQRPTMIGQIVGLPGETVRVVENAFVVEGQTLSTSQFPVPRWLGSRGPSVFVRPGTYLVSLPYAIQGGQAAGLTAQTVRAACLFEKGVIEGQAFMCWWPLRRRGFIE